MSIHKVEHVGVMVNNIDDSAAFYDKILGMELKEVLHPNHQTRLGFLGFPGQPDLIIELIERADAEFPNEGTVHHIAFTVDDVEREADRVAKLGINFLTEDIQTLENGSRYIFFKGPDGEHLELFQPGK